MAKATFPNDKDLQEPGSHNGRELELMLRELKPMAMFIAEDAIAPELVGDAELLALRRAEADYQVRLSQ